MAKSGLVELIKAGLRFFRNEASTTYVGIKSPSSDPATSYDIILPAAPPGSTQAVTMTSGGQLGFTALGGGGTVTNVALTTPSFLSVSGSPVTTSGTLAVSLASQTANTFFMAPNGSAGTPTFRSIVYADIGSLIGTTSSTLAAGNDSRFHIQNTDTGTTSATFQLNSGASGIRLKDVSGALQVRNSADSANADFTAGNVTVSGNLTVQGTTVTIDSQTLNVGDNIIVLNNDVSSGSPTEDGGIQVRRGASTSASLIWDETGDFWKAGLVGSETRVARYSSASFTNATLSSGILTFTHNLGNQNCQMQIIDNAGRDISPDEITRTSATVATIDLTSFGTLTGTWTVIAIG